MTPLRRIREKTGRKLVEVAKAVDYDAGNLSRVERGMQVPAPDIAARLAKYYGGAITELQILYPERYVENAADGRLRAQNQSPLAGPQP